MLEPDLVAALAPVVAELRRLDVPHYVGGSVASVAYGYLRATQDVDLVTRLTAGHLPALLAGLGAAYYASPSAAAEAVARRSCFNVIHMATSFKVDVFVAKDRPYDEVAMQRYRLQVIDVQCPEFACCIASPEDVILAKLEWYRLGQEVSEQQWRDVLGVLKVQQGALEWDYLSRWAAELNVADLLERARREADPSTESKGHLP